MDLYHLPEDGRFLIEANAGSGKTWQMTTLYAWLIATRGLTPDQIVVTTYTKAATQELQIRITARIQNFVEALEPPSPEENHALHLPDHAWQHLIQKKETALHHLHVAQEKLESMQIMTIHAFFLSLLKRHALVSGLPSESSVMETYEESQLWQQSVEYAWRQCVLNDGLKKPIEDTEKSICSAWYDYLAQDNRLTRYFTQCFINPDALQIQLHPFYVNPQLWIDPTLPLPAIHPSTWQDVSGDWLASLRLKKDIIQTHLYKGMLNQQSYKPAQIEKMFSSLTRFLSQDPLYTPRCDHWWRLTYDWLQIKKTKKTPVDWEPLEWHDALEKALKPWQEHWSCAQNWLYGRFVEVARDLALGYFERRSKASHCYAFNTMLTTAHQSIVESQNAALFIRDFRQQVRVILVDEFQDTNTLQWNTFLALQSAKISEPQPKRPVLLVAVGDPKQAIYRFRGADIYAYLQARDEMDEPAMLLNSNYRAIQSVVQAINQLFDTKDAFQHEKIDYQPSQAERPPQADDPMDFSDTPYQCIVIPNTLTQQDRCMDWAIEDCLQRIVHERRRYPNARIAILVTTNQWGEKIAQQASQYAIPIYFDSSKNEKVMSPLIEMWYQFLSALENPESLTSIAEVALTPFVPSLSTLEWQHLHTPPPNHTPLLMQTLLKQYQQLWYHNGILALWAALWRHGLPSQMHSCGLEMRDAEKLEEIAHHLATYSRCPHEQYAYLHELAHQRAIVPSHTTGYEQPGGTLEITTVHKAKGRQWNSVFCLTAWMARKPKPNECATPYYAHQQWRLMLQSPITDAVKDCIAKQWEQEELRKFYVMTTRATHRCTLYWPGVASQKKQTSCTLKASNPAYKLLEAIINPFKHHSDNASAWQCIFPTENTPPYKTNTPPRAFVSSENIPTETVLLTNKEIAPHQHFQLTETTQISFTYMNQLIAKKHDLWLLEDTKEDIVENSEGIDTLISDILVAPPPDTLSPINKPDQTHLAFAGKHFGVDVHAVLAYVLQQRQHEYTPRGIEKNLSDAISKKLRLNQHPQEHHERYQETVRKMAFRTLIAPWGFLQDDPITCLNQLPPQSYQVEWPFMLGWSQYDMNAWEQVCQTLSIPITPLPSYGKLKGSIDLLIRLKKQWWIIDFKTNVLENYLPLTLHACLTHHAYRLQAALYQLALHRHLRQTLNDYDPNQHLGGVVFLFLRGLMDDSPFSSPSARNTSETTSHKPSETSSTLSSTLKSKLVQEAYSTVYLPANTLTTKTLDTVLITDA